MEEGWAEARAGVRVGVRAAAMVAAKAVGEPEVAVSEPAGKAEEEGAVEATEAVELEAAASAEVVWEEAASAAAGGAAGWVVCSTCCPTRSSALRLRTDLLWPRSRRLGSRSS